MSKAIICTVEELKEHLKNTVSERRYIHSLGVAQTTERLLKNYRQEGNPSRWGNFSASEFCGLAHDLAREFSDASILEYCEKNNLTLTKDELTSPVLAHGLVASDQVKKLCGNYPASWEKAIVVHTTGASNMDALALAVFIADFIEPSRRFMTEQRRAYYLSAPTIESCAYWILCDMIRHWTEDGTLKFELSEATKAMKRELEAKGCEQGYIPWTTDWRK